MSIALRLPNISVTRVENYCASGSEAFRGLVKFLDHILSHEKVWIAKRIDIAKYWTEKFPHPSL